MPSIDPAPVKIDYSQYMSLESKNRKRSQLKELRPYFEIPGMISFGVGVPHPSTWPVNAMTVSVPFANSSVFIPGYNSPDPSSLLPLAPYTPPTKGFLAPDLTDELQYSATYGHKHLIAWVKEHLTRMHNPKYDGWEVLLTAGNTDGTDGIMRACLDRGDYLLVEEFAYPGLLSPAATLGIRTLGVPVDTSGIDPDALQETLANWDETERGGARPKFLLMVPTCSNPGGMTVPEQRKREIYAVCRRWDVMIIEDDPYCYLQIRPNGADSPIVPTFFSIDTDGRVLRIDSFSKFVAPGVRLGFVSGPQALVEKIMNTRESATQCPSGLSVATISAVLRAWGSHEGLEQRYIPHISDIYCKRCLLMIDLLRKHVPAATIEIPEGSGGMFLWVRLKVESHPDFTSAESSKTPEEISAQVFQRMISNKVLMCPSIYFKAPSTQKWTREQEAKRIFVRISYSLPPPEEMEEGTRRMAAALKAEWGL